MKDVLAYILQSIAQQPESITIAEEAEDSIIRFNVTVADEDYPRIIGRAGLTIKAITDIVRLVHSKNNPDAYNRIFINISSNTPQEQE